MTIGFDDDSNLVAVTQADAGLVCPHCRRLYEDEAPAATATRQAAMREVLQWLTQDSDVRRIGWKCVLANWLIQQGETQAELAARLDVSGARVSKLVKAFRNEISLYLQANREP